MKLFIIIVLTSLLAASCSENGKTKPEPNKIAVNNTCDSLDIFYKNYLERRDSLLKKRVGQPMFPIDTAVGNAYIDAYIHEPNKDVTEGIVLDIQTVAFLYKYLSMNPTDKIGLSIARYNDKYFTIGRSVSDPMYNVALKDRLALVIGAYDGNGFKPFKTLNGFTFYDDWNQEWP
jgi:hypothetical protein